MLDGGRPPLERFKKRYQGNSVAAILVVLVAWSAASALGAQEGHATEPEAGVLRIWFHDPKEGSTVRMVSRHNLGVKLFIVGLTPRVRINCAKTMVFFTMNDLQATDANLCGCWEDDAEVEECEMSFVFSGMRSSEAQLHAYIENASGETLAEAVRSFTLLVRNDTLLNALASKGPPWLTDDATSQLRWLQGLYLQERKVFSQNSEDGVLEAIFNRCCVRLTPAHYQPVPPIVAHGAGRGTQIRARRPHGGRVRI